MKNGQTEASAAKHEGKLKGGWQSDLLASIVVFLVALPLCMGIAIASGAPVAAGLLTGIIGGLVVGCLAGCPLQVSGPAAGLTVIVYEFIQQHGLEMLGPVVTLAGLMQITAGVLGLGQWFRAVSPAVIKGMLAGIGFLILGSQFHVMIDDRPRGSGAENLATIPQAIAKGLAWPKLDGREVRAFRSRMLREVGELHRQQVIIHERLSEYAPHNLQAEHSSTEQGAVPEQTLVSITGLQRRLVERLTATVRQLEEFELSLPPDHDLRSIGSVAKGSVVQLQAALDDLQPTSPQVAFDSQSAAVAALEQLLARLKNHHLAAYLGLLTILAIVLWQGLAPKRLRMLPPPLIAVVLATAAAATLTMPVLYVEVPDRLWEEIHFPTTAVWSNTPWESIWQTAVLLAVVASAETLLCATAVDQLHTGPRTRYGRELMAQGFGNMLCGLCGALPMTGVIVRSSANVQAGGQTRLSAILHGLWLLVFVVGLSFLLRLIPTASLAAMLVYTGYKLVDPKSLKELHKYGWSEVSVYAATVATIIFTDLLTGVLVGVGLSAIKLLYLFSHLEVELDVRSDQRQATLRLRGVATFLRLPKLAATLERVPPTVQLHVNIEHLSYIDHACLDLLANWDRQHEATGGDVILDWPELRARFQPQNSNSMTAHEMPTELEERQLQQQQE